MAKSVLSRNQLERLAMMVSDEEKRGFALMPPTQVVSLLKGAMVAQLSGAPNPENPRSAAKYTVTALGGCEVEAYRELQRRKEAQEDAVEALKSLQEQGGHHDR